MRAGRPASREDLRPGGPRGERRLDRSLLELAATSFIAGFTVVFGIIAPGPVHALVEPAPVRSHRLQGLSVSVSGSFSRP